MLEGEGGFKIPLCGVHARVAQQQIESTRARNPEITDRAKRYRAQNTPPPGPKRCTFCASRRNIDIDHIDGDEGNGDPDNLMYLCRSCNSRKGVTQARNKIGVRTAQFNPQRGASFAAFQNAAAVLLGIHSGDAGAATAAIRATPPAKRAEYAERIARNPAPPDFRQYVHGVTIHQRGSHDAGGKIIHATPHELRSEYARKIASIKRRRRGEVPF